MEKARPFSAVAFCVGVVAMGGHADAGYKENYTVVITPDSFEGVLSSVRNSANNTEYIGCWTEGDNSGGCSARNSAGTYKLCTTTNQVFLSTMRAINQDSFVGVRYNGGTCTAITVESYSSYAVKNH